MTDNIIHRPDSTTYNLTFPCHFIKDKEEMINVFKNVKKENVKIIQYVNDRTSFRPMLAVYIDNGEVFSMCEKYVYFVETSVAVKDKIFKG